MLRLVLVALVLVAAPASAQSVEDYFHQAAQHFVAGEMPPAEAAASEGLRIDPSDQKLRALLDEIRKKNPDDRGGREDQDAEQQRQQDGGQPQSEPGDESERQEPDEQGRPEEEGPPQEPGEQGEPQDEGEPQPPEDDDREAQRDGTGQQGQQPPEDARGGGDVATPFEVEPGQMSRPEAERILRALEADEVELLRDVQRRRARPRYVEQDW